MKNTRLKVQKILKSVIEDGLSALGITGFTVQEFASPQYVSLDKVVLMNLIRVQRLGWQFETYVDIGSSFKRKDEWLELEHWQIHMIAKRPLEQNVDTIVVEDVTEALIAWLNGPGMTSFRNSGIAPERVDGNTVFVYNDDNEIYQKRCVFTIRIQVPKEIAVDMPDCEILKPNVIPV